MDTGELERMICEARDSRRPSIDDVRAVMDGGMLSIGTEVVPLSAVGGGGTWSWEDTTMTAMGFPKFYVLTESREYPGYPLLTIRQAYSVRFDSWVTMSSLVIGPGLEEIARSISMAIAHHSGAFAGMRYVVGAISASGQGPVAGVVAAKMLMDAPPPIITGDDEERIVAEVDGRVVN